VDIHELNKIEIDIYYLSNWTLVIPKTTVCKKYILLLHTHKTTGNPLKIHTIEYSYVCERLDHYKIVYCTFWWKIGGMYETVIWLSFLKVVAVVIYMNVYPPMVWNTTHLKGIDYWFVWSLQHFVYTAIRTIKIIICND
jgi:hypothetical protein